jgi:hypothetical protein
MLMTPKKAILLSVTVAALLSVTAAAQTTQSVTAKSSAVAPDGSVTYRSETKITRAPVKPGIVTFYYFDPVLSEIITGSELTNDIISLWDTNRNNVIDNHEFYTNAMVVYEPIEYTSRTYQDIDGKMKLTQEEYTLRLQQLPAYRNLNKDGSEGLTLYEFTGVGFQDADHNNDNQVDFDEFKAAFFAKEGITRTQLKINE